MDHYFVSTNTTIDLNPHHYDAATGDYDLKVSHPELATLGVGVGYTDECTTFSVQYSQSFTNSINVRNTDQTLTFQLTLRTLAEAKTTTDLSASSSSKTNDGLFP